MHFNDAFKGKYLKAADLGGKVRRYTVQSHGWEEVGGEKKPVLRFDREDRGFVLNITNGTILKEEWGPDLDDWEGKDVLLKPDKTDFKGERVDCIRVAVPPRKGPPPTVKAGEEEAPVDINV